MLDKAEDVLIKENTVNFDNVNINLKESEMIDCNVARESTVTDMGIANIDATEQVGYATIGTAERIGLAADATAQRIGLAAEATAQRVGLEGGATAQRIGLEASATAQRFGIQTLESVSDASRDVIASVDRNAALNVNTTMHHGLSNRDATERTSDKTQSEVEKFGLSELAAISNAEKYLYAGMSQNAKDILMFSANEFERVKLQAAADTASIKHQQYEDSKQLLLQNCGDTDRILSQSAFHFKDILLQNCNDTASIKMQAEIHAKDAALAARDLIHLADKNTAAIQIEALKNKEELARQIAECCCENKALILETSHKTEDLVRKLDEQRLRDELAKAREELIGLRIRSTLPPALVGSVNL